MSRVFFQVCGLTFALAALLPAACTPAQTQQAASQYRQQSKKGLVILYFWGEHCNLCKIQGEEIAKFQQYSKVPVQKILPDTAMIRKYGLTRTPTLVLLKDGQVVQTLTGVTYEDQLKVLTKKYEAGAP